MRDLEDLVASLDFDEHGSLQMIAARWTGRACELLLDIGVNESDPPQAWSVKCEEVRAYQLSSEWADGARLLAEHPLLIPYVEPHVKLMFRGRAANPDAVVGQLWTTHRQLVGEWYPFDIYLNPGMAPSALLATGGGVLAEGPRNVMQAYAAVLQSHDVEPSFVAERPPVRWLDGGWQPEPPALRAFVMGESYVIGTGFHARREPGGHHAPVA